MVNPFYEQLWVKAVDKWQVMGYKISLKFVVGISN